MSKKRHARTGNHPPHLTGAVLGLIGTAVIALLGAGMANLYQTDLLAQDTDTVLQQQTVCGDGVCDADEKQSGNYCETDCGPQRSGQPTPTADTTADTNGSNIGRYQERDDMNRQIQNRERELRDMQRELDRCKKEAPDINYDNAGAAAAELQGYIDGMKSSLSGQPEDGLYNEFDSWLFWQPENDFGGNSHKIWDAVNVCNQERDKKNFENTLKNRERELERDINRQLEDIKRAGVDTTGSAVEQKLSECRTLINQGYGIMQKSGDTSWERQDLRSDMDWCFKNLWDELNVLNGKRQEAEQTKHQQEDLKNIQRTLKDKERMIERDMERELAKQQKEGFANEAAQECVNNLKGLLTEMEAAFTAGTPQDAWSINQDIDWKQQDCWELINKGWQTKEFTQRLRDRQREVEDKKRELKKISQELGKLEMPALQGIYKEAEEVIVKMEKLVNEIRDLAAQGEYDDARELDDWSFQDLRNEWEQIAPRLYMLNEIKFIKRDLKNGLSEMEKIENRVSYALERKKVAQGEADKCLGFIRDEARPKVKEAISKLDAGDLEFFEGNKGRDLKEFEFKGKRLCYFVMEGPGGFGGGPDIETFVNEDFAGTEKEILRRVMEKVEATITNRVMDRLSALSENLVDQLLARVQEKFQDTVAKTIESLSFVPQQYQNEILEKKAEVLEKVEDLDRLGNELEEKRVALESERAKLEEIKNKIANYNFAGEGAETIKEGLAAFQAEASSLTREQLKARLAEFESETAATIEANRQEKYELSIIPFRDSDDNDWHAKYAAVAKRAGVITGYKDPNGNDLGELRPGNMLTRLEAAKVTLEIAGYGDEVKRLGGWPMGVINAAKNAGITLGLEGNNSNVPITRAQVARMLAEASKAEVSETDHCSFADSCNHSEKKYIEWTAEQGIFLGNPGLNGGLPIMNPDGNFNRAEATAIVSRVVE